jgi:hypothetical protein
MMKRRTKRLSPADREALTRALAIARNSREPGEREMLDRLEKEEGWLVAAEQAVYHCQLELIRPRLWQPMPHDIDPADIETIIARGDDGVNGNFRAAKLLKKMLKAGLSRYEPDVVGALERAEARRHEAERVQPPPPPASPST